MLEEGHRRADRGTDVVVGFVETHGREHTADHARRPRGGAPPDDDLPRRDVHRARRRRRAGPPPEVVLVDELAHTNVPGLAATPSAGRTSRSSSTPASPSSPRVNVQHLESLNDVVAQITGVQQRETVPDEVVRRADQIELVDMTPEALRRRMAHGNVYPPEKVDAALGNYFRVGNLTALRELALLWLADKVDEQLDRYRAEHGIDAHLGDPRTGRRRAHRRPGGRHPDPPGRPDRRPHQGRRPARRARRPQRRARRRRPGRTWPGSASWSRASAAPTTRSSATTSRARCSTSPAASTPPSSSSAPAAAAGSPSCSPPGVGVTTTAESGTIDVHLVTHERGRPRARRTAAARRALSPRPPARRVRRRRWSGCPLLTAAAARSCRDARRWPTTSCSSSPPSSRSR